MAQGSASIQEGGEPVPFRSRWWARPPSTPPVGRPRDAPRSTVR